MFSTAEHPSLLAVEPPPTHEAAILHAAGFKLHAVALLQEVIASPVGRGDPRARAMLHELESPGQPPSPLQAPGTFVLKGTVGPTHPGLKALEAHARSRRAFAIDMGAVERIEYAYAGEFTAMLRGFHAAGRRVIVVNCRELEINLLEAMGAGRYVSFLRRAAHATELAAA